MRKVKTLRLLHEDRCNYTVNISRARNDSKYRLTAIGEGWSLNYVNTIAAEIADNGNGTHITFYRGLTFDLNYSQMEELRLLLNEYSRYPLQDSKYTRARIYKGSAR